MTGPTPPSRRGRHAVPEDDDRPGGSWPRPAARRATDRRDAAVPARSGRPAAARHRHPGQPDEPTGPLSPSPDAGGSPAHPSGPLPDLPPRPQGAWSRLQRRTDVDPDDAQTVAQPPAAIPEVPTDSPDGSSAGDRAPDPAPDPTWDDEEDATGGLEVLGATALEEPSRRRRRRRADRSGADGHDGHGHGTYGHDQDGHDRYGHDHEGHDRYGHDGYGPDAGALDEHPHDAHLLDSGVPGAARGGRSQRARRPVAVVLSLLVLAGLVAGIVLGGRALLGVVAPASEDHVGQGTGAVEVRIAVGDTLSDIARTLVEQDVIASVGPFVDAAEAEPAATGIQPGVYAMRREMSGRAALDLLLDPATRMFSRVTIPEGFTVSAVLQRLAEGTDTPLEQVQAAAQDTAALGLPGYADGSLEGFLYPATYDFEPGTAPADMLRTMVGEFTETATRLQLEQRAAAAGRSPRDVVVVASMVQSETRLDEERPNVAQVVYNRLAVDMPLGIDATLAYGLGKNGNDLTVADLETDSPYNTRTRAGLPPTPISSPGEASLEAALAPSAGDLLYYVLESSDGRHFFTSDYAEFQAARERCAAAGLGCGG